MPTASEIYRKAANLEGEREILSPGESLRRIESLFQKLDNIIKWGKNYKYKFDQDGKPIPPPPKNIKPQRRKTRKKK